MTSCCCCCCKQTIVSGGGLDVCAVGSLKIIKFEINLLSLP